MGTASRVAHPACTRGNVAYLALDFPARPGFAVSGLRLSKGCLVTVSPLGKRVTVDGGPRGSSPSRQRQKWRVYTGGHSEDSIGYLFLAPNVRNSTHRRRNRKSIDNEIGKAWPSES